MTTMKYPRDSKIINLTLRCIEPEQEKAGVFDPANKIKVMGLLSFESNPKIGTIYGRAKSLAGIAKSEGANAAMVRGPPYLIPALEKELAKRGIVALYVFWKADFVRGVTQIISY